MLKRVLSEELFEFDGDAKHSDIKKYMEESARNIGATLLSQFWTIDIQDDGTVQKIPNRAEYQHALKKLALLWSGVMETQTKL